MIPVQVAVLYQIFSRFFIDFRCFFDAYLQAYFEKTEKWKSAQNTINNHTNSMSGTPKKAVKLTKKSSKNSTKKTSKKELEQPSQDLLFGSKMSAYFVPRPLEGPRTIVQKKSLFWDSMRTAFFRFVAPQRGQFTKCAGLYFWLFFDIFPCLCILGFT